MLRINILEDYNFTGTMPMFDSESYAGSELIMELMNSNIKKIYLGGFEVGGPTNSDLFHRETPITFYGTDNYPINLSIQLHIAIEQTYMIGGLPTFEFSQQPILP